MAIISGVCGIAAFACLIAFLVMRFSDVDRWTSQLLLRSHDVGVIVQCLCLIPFALALDTPGRRDSIGSSRVMAACAVTFLTLVVVLVLLGSVKVVADVLYMIPQGAIGGWLIAVCRQKDIGLPPSLRMLGIVAGAGLLLISVFPVGYALFVDSSILHGPISDDGPTPPGTDKANQIIHLALAIGTLIGCSTYPVWTALAGCWLLSRRK